MLRTLLRVFFAFLAACFAASVVQVFFAFTPVQIATASEELSLLGILTIIPKAMVQSFLFAAPFVLVAAAIAEWQGIQDWIYYTLVGVAIAFAGFTTLHMGEGPDATLMHDYAMRAFLATGGLSGFVYWMAGGRDAGRIFEDAETNWVPDVRDAGAMAKGLKPKSAAATALPQVPIKAQPQPVQPTPPPVQTSSQASAQSSVPSAGANRPAPPTPPPALNPQSTNPRPPTLQGQPLTTGPSSQQQPPQQQGPRPDQRPPVAPPANKPNNGN